MSDKPFIEKCFLCERPFHGPHVYGRYIHQWDTSVCSQCYGANWDGIPPRHHSRLVSHLQSKGMTPPKHNEEGWIDWPTD